MVTLPGLKLVGYSLSRDGRIGHYYAAVILVVTFLYLVTRPALDPFGGQ